MESRNVRQILQSAATGSFLLLSASSLPAGHIFPEQPSRPHITAGCMPNWGFNQTCWQRFPPVPPCDGATGCNNNLSPMSHDYEQSGNIYTPQSGLVIPEQSIYSPPTSVLPPSANGTRYAVPSFPDSPPPGSQLILPNSVMPHVSADFTAPNQTVPQVPSISVPGTSFQTPPVRTFEAAPQAPSDLPPLPAPPVSSPQTQSQSSFVPHRLMFAPDGRIAAAPAVAPLFHATSSSRYGRKSLSMPAAIMEQQATLPIELPPQAGIPLHFANGANASALPPMASSRYGQALPTSGPPAAAAAIETAKGAAVHSISQSRSTMNSQSSSRYGARRPANGRSSAPESASQTILVPLRSTPPVL